MGCCQSKYASAIENIEYKDTSTFLPSIKYGKVIKVYDGDTFTIGTFFPWNKNQAYRFSVRIKHIDCPELRTTDTNEKEIALLAKQQLSQIIMGKVVRLEHIIYDKYGRLCCDVYCGSLNISDYMLHQGLAIPYEGKTKTPPKNWTTYYRTQQRKLKQK